MKSYKAFVAHSTLDKGADRIRRRLLRKCKARTDVLAIGGAKMRFMHQYQCVEDVWGAAWRILRSNEKASRQATIRHCGENNSCSLLRFRNAPSGRLDMPLATDSGNENRRPMTSSG
jgi:hypothetical protein